MDQKGVHIKRMPIGHLMKKGVLDIRVTYAKSILL